MTETKPRQDRPGRHVMVVAGEASGDLHGAALVRAMQAQDPTLTFSGMGGREMAEAGVDLVFDAAAIAVVGIIEVLGVLTDVFKARQRLVDEMVKRKPALLILIDYPDFNLLLAAKAKRLGIRVFYYISPQIWAWRRRRVHTIGRLTDRVAVILPFEQAFYARHGIEVDFVGHPLVDTVQTRQSKAAFLARLHVAEGTPVVGLLPGSRRKEIATLLPIFLDGARALERRLARRCVFLLPQASTIDRSLLDHHGLNRLGELDCRVFPHDRHDMMAACDAVVTASGTVTLELALLGVPAVVTYRISPRTYLLGRLLIRHIKYFSLPNLVVNRPVLPELLQDQVTAESVAEQLARLLCDHEAREATLAGLAAVRSALGSPGASQRAAEVALRLMAPASTS